MRALMLSAVNSGGGKTVLTCGLLAALKARGLFLQAFKCGPDYIDPMFHSRALTTPSRNLDLFLQGEAGVRRTFARAFRADLAVVEGAMGFYDGRERHRSGQRLGSGGYGGHSGDPGGPAPGVQPDSGCSGPGTAGISEPQPYCGATAQQLQAAAVRPPQAHPGAGDRSACPGIPASHGEGRPSQPPPGVAHRRGGYGPVHPF